MALPGVMYLMNACPQLTVPPPCTPKSNVSAVAGWFVVPVVVLFAWPVIDPEPIAGLVKPPWYQNQEPEQGAPVHVRVRVTFSGGGGAGFAWAGTTAGANTEAAMRTMKTPTGRIKSLTGAKRREMVEFICRCSFHSVIRHGVAHPACSPQDGTATTGLAVHTERLDDHDATSLRVSDAVWPFSISARTTCAMDPLR
jgi:hypothetical protein